MIAGISCECHDTMQSWKKKKAKTDGRAMLTAPCMFWLSNPHTYERQDLDWRENHEGVVVAARTRSHLELDW
jgi:hypothetical protein